MSDKTISVIVPAFNCAKTISRMISGILGQTLRDQIADIIVVDDGSTDGTASAVQSFQNVRYIRQENAGPAAARNHGARESKGELIFFTDSDCIPERDWLEKAVTHFNDPQVGAVAGSYGIANAEYLLARCIHKEIIFRHKILMPKFPKSFGSYNFGVRKNVFAEVGGFDEGYRYASGEDNDLSYKVLRCGHKIYFEKESRVRHFFPVEFGNYLLEQFRHGFWRAKMYRDHPRMAVGDDYTFWKDIIEPPLALLFLLVAALVLLAIDFSYSLCILLFLFLVWLELFYGILMTKNLLEGIFLAFVMFWRSFARALGFAVGLPQFFLRNSPKKIK